MKLTLDDIRDRSEKKYGDLTIETSEGDLVFRNLLRLSKADRKQVLGLIEGLSSDEDKDSDDTEATLDSLENARTALIVASKDKRAAKAFLTTLDQADVLVIFEEWSTSTQVGEAVS